MGDLLTYLPVCLLTCSPTYLPTYPSLSSLDVLASLPSLVMLCLSPYSPTQLPTYLLTDVPTH